jgi:hypothetical protein
VLLKLPKLLKQRNSLAIRNRTTFGQIKDTHQFQYCNLSKSAPQIDVAHYPVSRH